MADTLRELERADGEDQRRPVAALLEDPNAGDASGTGGGTELGALRVYSAQGKDRKGPARVSGFGAQVGSSVFPGRAAQFLKPDSVSGYGHLFENWGENRKISTVGLG